MSLTRRRLLVSAGAVVGGALIGGACGADEAAKEPPSDATVLRGLLALELAAGAPVVGFDGAELMARQDGVHAERLAAAAGLADAGRPGTTSDLAGALARKQEAMFAYVEALPRLANPDLRLLVMQVAASEAGHLVLLRAGRGDVPVPDAFAGFTAPGAA